MLNSLEPPNQGFGMLYAGQAQILRSRSIETNKLKTVVNILLVVPNSRYHVTNILYYHSGPLDKCFSVWISLLNEIESVINRVLDGNTHPC